MCGSNNKTTLSEYGSQPNGGLIAGYNNTVDALSGTSICLGANNVVYGNNQIFIGFDNTAHNSTSFKSVCLGRGLAVDNQNLKQKVVVGTYNSQTASLESEKGKLQTIIGGGDSEYIGHRHNAIEVYSQYQGCLVVFPKQIALSNYTTSNKASVNAIVPPADPNNVTADDQTLATKAYVASQIPVVPSIPTDLVLGTSYAISAGNETLTPNTPITLATIIGDNSWVFPYSSGTLKIFFKYPLISKIVCEATFLIDGTTTSGKVNSSFSYCMNNGHDVGYIKGGLICLDYSTMSIELKYGEGIDVSNIDEAIDSAYTDNTTTATLVRIHCTNLY